MNKINLFNWGRVYAAIPLVWLWYLKEGCLCI